MIDPTVSYSTYFGGSGSETYPSIAVNGDGFIYLAGSTTSTDLPVASSPVTPKQSSLNGAQNIFILKLDPTAGAAGILYLTYLGGSGTDISSGLAVDTRRYGVCYGHHYFNEFSHFRGRLSDHATGGHYLHAFDLHHFGAVPRFRERIERT